MPSGDRRLGFRGRTQRNSERKLRSWELVAKDTSSPREALDLIAGGEPFDALVIDYKMPDVSGLDLARQIRAARGEAAPPW